MKTSTKSLIDTTKEWIEFSFHESRSPRLKCNLIKELAVLMGIDSIEWREETFKEVTQEMLSDDPSEEAIKEFNQVFSVEIAEAIQYGVPVDLPFNFELEEDRWQFVLDYEWYRTSAIDYFDDDKKAIVEFVLKVEDLNFDSNDVEHVENAISDNPEVVLKVLNELHDLGVSTGYVEETIAKHEANCVCIEKFQREFAMDIAEGVVSDRDVEWPFNCIDWDEAWAQKENEGYNVFTVLENEPNKYAAENGYFYRHFIGLNPIL